MWALQQREEAERVKLHADEPLQASPVAAGG